MSEDDEKKKENTPKRPSSRCGRRTHGKPRVLRAVRRAVQATVVLEKHCVNLLDTKLVVGFSGSCPEQDVCSLVKLLVGAARPSVGAGRPLPGIQASRLSSSMSVGGVGYPLRCGAPASRLLLRCTADLRFHFLKRLPFRFFLIDRNSREMGEKGTGTHIAVGMQRLICGRKK